eukprot:TRINITY_DN124020_c0_g1_i1.p3 TRINITY_DN124020_c0_g1~~TRINITY_DN124020_c0_g1_i1.p3  ORF type:complete len:101 (+),score=28.29 TRINITY_DN124020_c0_g1_i1:112-414(+)
MSIFVYPKHGMISEMMQKELNWTAKFIKEKREEDAIERKREKRVQDVIDSYFHKTDARRSAAHGQAPSTPAMSRRAMSTGSLGLAGAMSLEPSVAGSRRS